MNFNLLDRTILLAVAGSRAYGTHRPESDVDVKGVCVPHKISYLGINHNFEQADSPDNMQVYLHLLTDEEKEVSAREKLEGSVYEIRKFITLAADANPNILDALFCDERHLRKVTPEGRMLIDNRHLFISARAKHTFSGYAAAQFKRIKTHRKYLLDPPKCCPSREDFGLPQVGVIPKNQLDAALDAVKKKTDEWETDLSTVPSEAERIAVMEKLNKMLSEILAGTDGKFASAGRLLGYSNNFIELLEKERRFRAAQDEWTKFNSWKKARNPVRAELEEKYGFDTKHASHLVRLMRMCREILVNGQVNVDRTTIDAQELIAIRNGEWTYERLEEFFVTEDWLCTEIYKNKEYVIPKSPDMNKIEDLCVSIISKLI